VKRPVLLGRAEVPGGGRRLSLYQGKDDCSIVMAGAGELMSTRRHASEDALGRLPCEMLTERDSTTVLIGGLGMGFTLAAVLACSPDNSIVTVAELLPEVVEWNRGPLGHYAGYPLNDSRTEVYPGDVADLLRAADKTYDVIALDVDNGPEALSADGNRWLYSNDGIVAAVDSLNRDGVLAYWSASQDPKFVARLSACNLKVTQQQVYAHGKKGTRHVIWLATRRT